MNERDDSTPDDSEIADLLRSVGAREEPAPEIAQQVQAAVYAEWRHEVASRRRRRTGVWALAASVCAMAVGTAITVQYLDEEGELTATLMRTNGEVYIAHDASDWTRMVAGQQIAVGDSIRSDAQAALAMSSGVSVRLDRGTLVHVNDSDRFTLDVGAVYVDSGVGRRTDSLTISTKAGSVRHLGTQYEVRTQDAGIDVSVREGRVMIESDRGSNVANAGERLTVSIEGSVQRVHLSQSDPQWGWATDIAPTFPIENTSLASFLEWVARETGRKLVYESQRARVLAAGEILHGSIEGLSPDAALDAVLLATSLHRDGSKLDVIQIGIKGMKTATR